MFGNLNQSRNGERWSTYHILGKTKNKQLIDKRRLLVICICKYCFATGMNGCHLNMLRWSNIFNKKYKVFNDRTSLQANNIVLYFLLINHILVALCNRNYLYFLYLNTIRKRII